MGKGYLKQSQLIPTRQLRTGLCLLCKHVFHAHNINAHKNLGYLKNQTYTFHRILFIFARNLEPQTLFQFPTSKVALCSFF